MWIPPGESYFTVSLFVLSNEVTFNYKTASRLMWVVQPSTFRVNFSVNLTQDYQNLLFNTIPDPHHQINGSDPSIFFANGPLMSGETNLSWNGPWKHWVISGYMTLGLNRGCNGSVVSSNFVIIIPLPFHNAFCPSACIPANNTHLYLQIVALRFRVSISPF